MRAAHMRIILAVGFVLLFSALCGAGWWVQKQLEQQVIVADHATTDAELSQLEVDKLRHLQSQLEAQKDIVERASQIAATASNYQYQDQVVKDLEAYANRNGVSLGGFDFASQSAKAGAGPAGTTRTPFSISLKGPLEFDRFMSFLNDIENNLTKLQVSSLSLTPTPDNTKMVSNPSISLVVYLKK